MTRTLSRLQVGIVLDGPGADPGVRRATAAQWHDPQQWRDAAVAAEAGGFGFVVLPDRGAHDAAPGESDVPRPDPLELGAHLAAVTDRIVLVVQTPLTHAEPFHLSNRLSSLDRATRGRLGWWTGVDDSRARARAYGHPAVPDRAVAEREAVEVLEAVRRLWDSWEDGALVADVAGGRFLDRDRIHYIDYEGEFFSVRGPALLPRPVQGSVPVLAGRGEPAGLQAEIDVVTCIDDVGSRPALLKIPLSSSTDLGQVMRAAAGKVDGVILVPDDTLAALDGAVLAPLAADGLLQPSTGTLRDRFGLARPISRYSREAMRA